SQVLSGGRMKAGAVQFADTPDEAAAKYEHVLPIVVGGEKARCVLVEAKSKIVQEYFVSVTWDGRRKLPVLLFSDMGGIDIEEVAESPPEHLSRTPFSTFLPLTPRLAKEAIEPEVNLMPALIDASRAYATVGEMMNTMAGVFGRHVEVPTI
ncbi:MAG: ATP-grasp domain-containing protein, partial [Ilumatobacteraceae bacterium]